jgi:hypothetical protein
MALFVPTGNPWGGGLQALADAVTQAPMNRAKVRQMELEAANAAADNARADAQLKLQQEQFRISQENSRVENEIRRAQEGRATELHPFAVEQNTLANEVTRGSLHKTQTENMLEDTRIAGLPGLSGSLADSVYTGVSAGLPEWNLVHSLSQPALPPKITLPGMEDSGMDYPGMGGPTSGMDEINRRMGIRDQIGTLADAAVLSDPKLDTAKWIKDTTEAMLAGDPTATAAVASGQFGDTDFGRAATVVAQLREKKRQGIPLSPFEQDQLSLAMSKVAPVTSSTSVGPHGEPITNVTRVDPFAVYPGSGAAQPEPQNRIVQPDTIPAAPAVSQGTSMYPVSPETAGAVSQPPAVTTLQPGATPVPPSPTNRRIVDGVEITTIGQRADKPRTEYENKANYFSTLAGTTLRQLAPIIGLDLNTGVYDQTQSKIAGTGNAIDMRIGRLATDWLGDEFRGTAMSPETQMFANGKDAILDSVVRFVSGAATPPPEYTRAGAAFIPDAMGSPEANFQKLVRLMAVTQTMEDIAARTGIDPAKMTDQQLQAVWADGSTQAILQQYEQDFGLKLKTPAAVAPAAPQTVSPATPDLSNVPTEDLLKLFNSGAQ